MYGLEFPSRLDKLAGLGSDFCAQGLPFRTMLELEDYSWTIEYSMYMQLLDMVGWRQHLGPVRIGAE